MPLYEFKEDEAKFLQNMVTKISFQGTIDQLEKDIQIGKKVIAALNKPIQPAGKPKESDPRKRTDLDQVFPDKYR